jgi:predicted nicotinamide N-methyase
VKYDIADLESFFAASTCVAPVDLCPEIELHVAPDLPLLWRELEVRWNCVGLPPPYWGTPWPGGVALARFILDHRALVQGRSVLDLGSGSGLCAIAAALSGGRVTAADTDPVACFAIAANARLNGIDVDITAADPVDGEGRWDVVLAADLWYERFMAGRITSWLRQLAGEGTDVFLGDLGRAYFPRREAVERGRFRIDAAGSNEQNVACDAIAWQLPRACLPSQRLC